MLLPRRLNRKDQRRKLRRARNRFTLPVLSGIVLLQMYKTMVKNSKPKGKKSKDIEAYLCQHCEVITTKGPCEVCGQEQKNLKGPIVRLL